MKKIKKAPWVKIIAIIIGIIIIKILLTLVHALFDPEARQKATMNEYKRLECNYTEGKIISKNDDRNMIIETVDGIKIPVFGYSSYFDDDPINHRFRNFHRCKNNSNDFDAYYTCGVGDTVRVVYTKWARLIKTDYNEAVCFEIVY